MTECYITNNGFNVFLPHWGGEQEGCGSLKKKKY